MITYKDITTPNSEILADLMYQGIYQTAGKKKYLLI